MTEPRALILAGVLILMVAIGDYRVGYDVTFSIFYLLPIAIAGWYTGRWAGYTISVISAVSWLVDDVFLAGHVYEQMWVPYWNAVTRLLMFLIVTTLLATAKRALQAERLAYVELDRARKEQLAVKDQLLSHVSHELRTPLAAAHQFLTIVQDRIAGDLTPEQDEYLGIAERNVRQLARMIDDLLDATRSESGKLAIAVEPVPLGDLLSEMVRTMRSPAEERGVALALEVEPGLPEVEADPVRVRQVVVNLLDNAVKFTPAGGTVSVRAMVHERGGEALVSVRDTGPGIPPEDQKRIFQRMFQVSEEDASSRRGLGLGLYICREILTRQGGRIWVESVPGKGSTFHFTLPTMRS